MSFNRVLYDTSAYDLQMNRSIGPGDYRLFPYTGENCAQCFSEFGPVGSKSDVSLVKKPNELQFTEMADIESKLSWRNNKLGKNNNNVNPLLNVKLYHKQSCSAQLTTEDTRFTHPLTNYRGMSVTELMLEPYLHVNPQCYIQEISDRQGLNSRLYSKDLYKSPPHRLWESGGKVPSPFLTDRFK
jgi:hypothetical protein